MKIIIIPAVLLSGLTFSALAQTDTTLKKEVLKEVIIVDHKNAGDAFSFHKSGQLSTTEDILARMPGVNMIRRGAYGLEPSLRIYSAGQINVTIDGMKLYGACTDKMDPASIYIEPNNLQEISIGHGAAGNALGSTIGGGMNMILKRPAFSHRRSIIGRVSQSYATVNSGRSTSVSINASSRVIASAFGFVFRKAGNYKDGAANTVSFSQYQKMNWSGVLSYKLNERNTLSVQYLGDVGKNIGFPALAMDVGAATAHIASFGHQFFRSVPWFKNGESKLYYNNVYHTMDDTKRPSVPIHMDMPGWSETLGVFHQNASAWRKHIINFRIDGHYNYTRADMIMYPSNEAPMYMQTLPGNNLYNSGASVQYTFLTDSIQSIQSSFRVDYFRQFANQSIGSRQWEVMNKDVTKPIANMLKNGSLSYIRQLSKRIEATITASYGERLPTTNERYGYYLYIRFDGFDYIGDPNLKPESAWQGEMKIKLETKRVKPHVNLFYHYIQNYIYPFVYSGYSSMTIGARGVKGYANIQSATLQGLEAGASYEPVRSLLYITAIKFTYARTFNAIPLAQVPPLKVQHALRWEYKTIQVQGEYDWAAAQQKINPQSGERQTSSWHLVNLRLARSMSFSRYSIQMNIACENIFNTWYREHLDWGNIGRPSRNFIGTLTLMFR